MEKLVQSDHTKQPVLVWFPGKGSGEYYKIIKNDKSGIREIFRVFPPERE